MANKIFEIIKKSVAEQISIVQTELIAIAEGQTTDRETGEINRFVKVSAEVAKRQGIFSRTQFDVKISDGRVKVDPAELENGEKEFEVFFKNLEISYIDSKGNVYFRAENYDIEEIQEV